MPASPAQIAANKANAAKSTGPKTPEGKEASRGNAVTHGLTATKVLPEREVIEVMRRSAQFIAELNPSGEVGVVLARHAARMSVRMERCAEHETVTLTEHVRKAVAEFVVPEGVDEAEARRLLDDVERKALFDGSKEASLARKYEGAAERGFFRALKELRLHEKAVKEAEAALLEDGLGSISPGGMTDEEFDALEAAEAEEEVESPRKGPSKAVRGARRAAEGPIEGSDSPKLQR